MRCEDVRSRFKPFIDGDLSQDERFLIRTHLCECAGCRSALERVDRLAAILLLMENPAASAGLTAKVMAAVRTHRDAKTISAWNPFVWWRMTTVPMHAAAVVVLLIGLMMGFAIGRSLLSGGNSLAGSRSSTTAAALDLYNLDYLSDLPGDSLAGVYVALSSGRYASSVHMPREGR